MTFAQWALTDAEKLVRVDLKAWDGSEEISLFIATRYYLDSVNDNEYLDRLVDPLIIRRSINWTGGSAEASVGAISIDNSDRELDDWIDYGWHGREVEILLGDPSWAADDSRWSTRFKCLADKIEAEDDVLTLFTRDLSERLDRPIVERPLLTHPQTWLEPEPLSLGKPQNVSLPKYKFEGGLIDQFAVGIWEMESGVFDEVYENGLASSKTVTATQPAGGLPALVTFDSASAEGMVTADPKSSLDAYDSGDAINKPGAILKRVLTYDIDRECGIALGGSSNTIDMDENAVQEDDHYNLQDLKVAKRSAQSVHDGTATDYVGSTRELTYTADISAFSVDVGDYYSIGDLDTTVRLGPLETSELNTDAFDDLDSDADYDLGIWTRGGDLTFLDLMNTILPGGFWYTWTRDAKITCGLLKDPSEDSSVFTIDQYESRGKLRLIQEDAPIYRARVGYNRNYTVINSPDPDVSEDRAAFLSREYVWELDQDLSIRDAYPKSKPQDFRSAILGRADAQTEAKRLMDLFGVARKRIMVEGLSGLFSVDLHDVVTLKDDTYGLDDGKDYRVVMMEERPIEGTVDVELWG